MAPETAPCPKLLTPKDAAAACAISPRKLWSLTASGDIPCVRIGRSVRYDAMDLAAFIDAAKAK
jgi:predicted DNA-binding transcriptional regulator AlpA